MEPQCVRLRKRQTVYFRICFFFIIIIYPLFLRDRSLWSPSTVGTFNATFFLISAAACFVNRVWLVRADRTAIVIGWECPVDRRWIPWETQTLEAKNSSYTTAPCAYPERGWNNHWELVCTQTLLNSDKTLLFWIIDAVFFTLSARFFGITNAFLPVRNGSRQPHR